MNQTAMWMPTSRPQVERLQTQEAYHVHPKVSGTVKIVQWANAPSLETILVVPSSEAMRRMDHPHHRL
jgi:hypothetical protein